jgi:hypothetical protein
MGGVASGKPASWPASSGSGAAFVVALRAMTLLRRINLGQGRVFHAARFSGR